jgi:hypothetical protein
VLLAVLTWHLYEKHFLKLKRFFEYREKRSPGAKSTTAPSRAVTELMPASTGSPSTPT